MYGLVQNRDLDQNSTGTKNVCSLRLSTGYSLKKDLIDLVQKLTIALSKRTLVIRRPEYWTPRRRPRGVPKLCSWMLAPQFGCIMVFSYRHCVKNWKFDIQSHFVALNRNFSQLWSYLSVWPLGPVVSVRTISREERTSLTVDNEVLPA